MTIIIYNLVGVQIPERPKRQSMTVRKIEIERLTITSSRSFETVVAALEAVIGRPDMAEFMKATRSATTYAELQSVVQQSVSAAGLMLFMKLNAGAVMRSESGLASPKAQRFRIGNPLIMKDMAKHVPEAASYAPVTVLVDDRPAAVHPRYHNIASSLAPNRIPQP